MQCSEVRNHFADYVNEDLDESIQEELSRHVKDCPSCRAELEELTELWVKLGTVPVGETASPDLEVRLHAELEGYKREQKFSSRNLRASWKEWSVLAAAAALLITISFGIVRRQTWTDGARAAEAVDGSLYRVIGATKAALPVGADIRFSETLDANGTGAVFVMSDGSRVEMRSHSQLSLEPADDGVRIRLSQGGVIVDAAKQKAGRHLYVQTRDVSVSVVGTVFLVNAEEEGSRVAVIEGAVHVRQGETEKELRPGEQVATSPTMEPLRVAEEIAWSRHAETHRAELKQSLAQTPSQAAVPAPASAPAEERVAFEVASVRPVPPSPAGGRGGAGGGGPLGGCGGIAQFDPSQFSFRNVTVFALIAWAYTSDACSVMNWSGQVSGGPAWIKSDRFNIEAVIPAGVSTLTSGRFATTGPPLLQKMVRTLLAERFKLVLHRENRDIPVYALTVAKGGSKLRPSGEGSCVAPEEVMTQLRSSCGSSTINLRAADQVLIQTFKVNLDEFAKFLVVALDRPVINRTGLAGGFDIILEFVPDHGVVQEMPVGAALTTGPVAVRGAPPPASGASIFTALQEQLGLKLEPSTGPVETLVIDRVEKPAEN